MKSGGQEWKGLEMVEIRKARMEDENELFALFKQFPPENIPGSQPLDWDRAQATFREIVGNEQNGTILLAEEDDDLAGLPELPAS